MDSLHIRRRDALHSYMDIRIFGLKNKLALRTFMAGIIPQLNLHGWVVMVQKNIRQRFYLERQKGKLIKKS